MPKPLYANVRHATLYFLGRPRYLVMLSVMADVWWTAQAHPHLDLQRLPLEWALLSNEAISDTDAMRYASKIDK